MCLGARQPGPHRLNALGYSPQPVTRDEPEPVVRVLAGNDPHVERKAIERPRQAVQKQPGNRQEERQQHAARNGDRGDRGLAQRERKRRKTGREQYCKANEQRSDESGEGTGLRARHVQPRGPSMRRIRSTSSRVENGFVTYSSAPSESPFSR